MTSGVSRTGAARRTGHIHEPDDSPAAAQGGARQAGGPTPPHRPAAEGLQPSVLNMSLQPGQVRSAATAPPTSFLGHDALVPPERFSEQMAILRRGLALFGPAQGMSQAQRTAVVDNIRRSEAQKEEKFEASKGKLASGAAQFPKDALLKRELQVILSRVSVQQNELYTDIDAGNVEG